MESILIAFQIFSLMQQSVTALEKLAALQGEVAGASVAAVACDNLQSICPISPFGTYNEYVPGGPVKSVPQITIKYTDAVANRVSIGYSISDIQDNQSEIRLQYGKEPENLNQITLPAIVSYDITNAHGIDDANFLFSVPHDEVCMYARHTEDETTGDVIYNPDPPAYYFRFEVKNDLGTFYTPSLDAEPYRFQFDNLCGEQLHHYLDGMPQDY